METDEFDQKFAQDVEKGVEKQKNNQLTAEKTQKRRIVIVAAIIVLVLAIAIILVIVLSNNSTNEVADNDSTDEGSAREYDGDDDDDDDDEGTLTAIRMGCTDNDGRYDFYKDNTYEMMSFSTDEIVESGSYTIDGKNINLEAEGEKRTVVYDGKKITDGTFSYECEEYDNV
ncbi:hypothetical protein J6X15_02895 [Candidatus Saccharibacteria bacterium]|nr:hypothetical protein [Candidatus Saccharibacteria bacterium]